MCGIIAAINGKSVVSQLMTGLARLEYRGYDSAGLAFVRGTDIEVRRAQGKIVNLRKSLDQVPLDGRIGIAHTRWATHGRPSVRNAHPHMTEQVAVVHNGIIENYRELRIELEAAGHRFDSETDSEVVPRLITNYLQSGCSPEDATVKALDRLTGSFALAILFAGFEDRMIAARQGSPLVIGIGEGANFIASDGLALSGMATQIIHLEDGDWATVGSDAIEIRNSRGATVQRPVHQAPNRTADIGKNGYRHFMKKEIHEQPGVIRKTLEAYCNKTTASIDLPLLPFDLTQLTRLHVVACGTSYHAGLIAKYWLEKYARLSVDVDTASEFCYREPVLTQGGVSLFISQSGETADTLSALRHAKANGQHVMALVNSADSTMAREADVVIHTKAGPEIGVASTKAFTTQLSALACLVIAVGRARGSLEPTLQARLFSALQHLPNAIETVIEEDQIYISIAKKMVSARSVLFVGRGTAFPVAMEGALKLKEISYIHAEAHGAGELKHGPIALIDGSMPVVVVAPSDPWFEKTICNLQEINARGGNVILLSSQAGLETAGDEVLAGLAVPDCDPFVAPILYSVPLQMIAYHVACLKGTDIDQPRNLAKSVTVE